MSIRFIDESFDKKNLTADELSGMNKFLLENNKKQLETIYNFYGSCTQLLLVNGFLGTGKTQIIHHSLKFLNSEAIVLEYNCFETTILDDILLALYEEFRELTAKGLIFEPKIKTENFAQKISSYFNSISKPIVLIINSLESILKPNKQDVVDFLLHIMQFQNTKVIVVSRKPDYESFTEKIKFERVTILALEKSIFEKYLRSEGIKLIGPVSDELYKHTRGYFLYTQLTTKVINAHKLSLIDFLEGYTKSFLSYNDFILREALAFVDPSSGHLFRLLTVIRHPISVKLLETINMYDEEKIQFFVDNLLICRDKNSIYLQDYYKEISLNSIPENVLIKLHKSCVELYTMQLPLKPFERDILVSRQTMRSEIEYHTMFLPKHPQLMKKIESAAIEAIEYAANSSDYDSIPKTEEIPMQPDVEIIRADEENPQVSKEEKIKKISFIFDNEDEEKQIMDGIANSINEYIDYSNKILNQYEGQLPFMELMNAANKEEANFNYKKAIAYYQQALTLKDDDNFPNMVSRIYSKCAQCYENLSDWFNAVKYYNIALQYYSEAGDIEKINSIKMALAHVFYNTYKHDKAELLVKDVLNETESIPNEIKIKAHMLMAALKQDDINTQYKNYKAAYELIETGTSRKILAELYFKFATVCDDADETETAIKLYQRCMDINNENPYRASSMSNLATIFDDTGASDLAAKYYNESLNIDILNKNYAGIYESSLKLAKIYKRKDAELAHDYYRKASNAAKELNEPYYMMNVNIEYGDFCVDKKDFKKALRSYIIAMSRTKNATLIEYKPQIEQRLRDLKIRLGEEEFKKLEKEIVKNG